MTRHALALAPVAHPDAQDAATYDDSARDAPPLRLTPRNAPPASVVPDGYRVPARGGAVVVAEHGDLDQPNEATTSHYARYCVETCEPATWRRWLESGGFGRPWARLTVYPDVDTMRDHVRGWTMRAGELAPNVRVVLPPEVWVRIPGVGTVWATATDETRDGVPVVGVAETTAAWVRAAMRER